MTANRFAVHTPPVYSRAPLLPDRIMTRDELVERLEDHMRSVQATMHTALGELSEDWASFRATDPLTIETDGFFWGIELGCEGLEFQFRIHRPWTLKLESSVFHALCHRATEGCKYSDLMSRHWLMVLPVLRCVANAWEMASFFGELDSYSFGEESTDE